MTLKKEFKTRNMRRILKVRKSNSLRQLQLLKVRKSNSLRQLLQAQEKQVPNVRIRRIIVYER